MTVFTILRLVGLAERIGMKIIEKRSQTPIEEWTEDQAKAWLDKHEAEIDSTPTDELLPPLSQDDE